MPRIVAISDTHGGHRRTSVPDGDILIHAGDFTRGGRLKDIEEFDDWLAGLPHTHKFVVPGNCDGCCESRPEAVRERLTQARYLFDASAEVEGLHIWGSPWQPVFLNMAFNVPRGDALAEKWAAMPDEVDVLVTHGPPAGVLDRTSKGQEVGDKALMARVTEVRPRLHVFGHVHESSGREERQGTTFVNAACDRKGKEPFVIDL